MSAAFLLAIAVAAQALGSRAPSPATASELNSMASAVRAFVPQDEFDAGPPQRSLAGRPFLIEVQPWGTGPPKMACFGYPMWSYSRESGTLHVSTGASKLMLPTDGLGTIIWTGQNA